MDLEALRKYCLSKPAVTEEFPFNEEVLVFKVAGKMFVLTNIVDFDGINVKVDPEKGAELREQYATIRPAFHMNKKHWITVSAGAGVTDSMICGLVDDSYELVVQIPI